MRISPLFFPITVAALIASGCSSSGTKHTASAPLDGEALAKAKCAQCHNLDMPPKTSEDEKAPPLFTITVHLKDWIKADTDTERRAKFIAFAKDYTLNPTREKSYCDEKSLKSYGLMPSQKGNVTANEVGAIAAWAYDHYDQMAMLAIVKERNRIARLPLHEQVLETHDCRSCHILGNGKLAPTFKQIGAKYGTAGIEQIKNSITHGSRGKWPAFHVPMRAYTDLTPKQLQGMAEWIAKQK
jgi:cytochrome c